MMAVMDRVKVKRTVLREKVARAKDADARRVEAARAKYDATIEAWQARAAVELSKAAEAIVRNPDALTQGHGYSGRSGRFETHLDVRVPERPAKPGGADKRIVDDLRMLTAASDEFITVDSSSRWMRYL